MDRQLYQISEASSSQFSHKLSSCDILRKKPLKIVLTVLRGILQFPVFHFVLQYIEEFAADRSYNLENTKTKYIKFKNDFFHPSH